MVDWEYNVCSGVRMIKFVFVWQGKTNENYCYNLMKSMQGGNK